MLHLAVHGHFYQPPRENPWTETVPVEPSAAPYHDWNERITAEAYRPNARARIVDDRGRVVAIVNDYALLSFNIGPTLASWLEVHHPGTYELILAADADAGTAIAQAYNHLILPLASERDVRTQVRWGLADFEHRFGRPAAGLWLPETAVNDAVLAVLVEEGVGFTILSPSQAATPVASGHAYQWEHPGGAGSIALVFYDGALSHDIAFGIGSQPAAAVVSRAQAATGDGLVLVATDGETFGHHHRHAERAVAYALAVEAPRRKVGTGPIATWLRAHPPRDAARVHESAWSCAHGVGRWKEDCGCSSGGRPGWNQAWRRPLRAALDLLRDHAAAVFDERGGAVLRDPWAARDDYIDVVLDRTRTDAFVARHVRRRRDRTLALTLLEAQRHTMLMYTSCGWFFDDIAGLEAIQVLRYAARCMDLLRETGDEPPADAFLAVLDTAVSNDPDEGTGRRVWERHVMPARVPPARVVAHIALLELLDGLAPQPITAGYDVVVADHGLAERGTLALASGTVELVHRRTGAAHRYVYAALHLGALEVVGACRAAGEAKAAAADRADLADLAELRAAFAKGTRLTQLLRLVTDRFGPDEFDISAALPDAPDRLLRTAAQTLADRFGAELDRLFTDHRDVFTALTAAGYALPEELRTPALLALARRLEASLAAVAEGPERAALAAAEAVVAEAAEIGVGLDVPAVRAAAAAAVDGAVARAVASRKRGDVALAVAVVTLIGRAGMAVDMARAQEAVYDVLVSEPASGLGRLGTTLGLAVGHLGVPV
jgi:hypothetical protein